MGAHHPTTLPLHRLYQETRSKPQVRGWFRHRGCAVGPHHSKTFPQHIHLDVSDQKRNTCMTDLGIIFEELGISQYLESFLEQGFDTWETILDITESDFDALGVKLGHRRKLQRKIASCRGVSDELSLVPLRRPSVEHSPGTGGNIAEDGAPAATRPVLRDAGAKDAAPTTNGKRKYRRHPKVDENAPERPPSAYVIFSNKMRENLKGRNLSFTEIAKLVGENWQTISATEKEVFESQASNVKQQYNTALAQYKKTESYKKHLEYLADFKAKQPHAREASEAAAAEGSKRPKLENQNSAGSSGTASSATSHSGEPGTGRPRDANFGSAWYAGAYSPPASGPPYPNHSADPVLNHPLPGPSALPGYRDSIFGAQQTLAWRETGREPREPDFTYQQQVPRLISHNDRRGSTGGISGDRGAHLPPPLLTSESTSGATTISSSSSASQHAPRTPLDVTRSTSSSSGQAKGINAYELPPIRPPSLSPQSSLNAPYHSPSGVTAMDYAPAISSGLHHRPYQHLSQPPPVLEPSILSPYQKVDEGPMDPVSALLRAGEIVNRRKGWLPPPAPSK